MNMRVPIKDYIYMISRCPLTRKRNARPPTNLFPTSALESLKHLTYSFLLNRRPTTQITSSSTTRTLVPPASEFTSRKCSSAPMSTAIKPPCINLAHGSVRRTVWKQYPDRILPKHQPHTVRLFDVDVDAGSCRAFQAPWETLGIPEEKPSQRKAPKDAKRVVRFGWDRDTVENPFSAAAGADNLSYLKSGTLQTSFSPSLASRMMRTLHTTVQPCGKWRKKRTSTPESKMPS